MENIIAENCEVIVVDGDGGSSIELLHDLEDKNLIKIDSKKGRANQMNTGASIAKNEILLFLHADTILPKDAIKLIQDTLKEETIKAGAFDLSFDNNSIAMKIIAKTASIRSRLTKLPYGDQAIFIKKDIFNTIGGYENISLMEDVNLMQKLKRLNHKIKILKEKVTTSARKWENRGVIYTTLRNWLLITLYFLKIDPNKLSKYYK